MVKIIFVWFFVQIFVANVHHTFHSFFVKIGCSGSSDTGVLVRFLFRNWQLYLATKTVGYAAILI
jgi:hypothetical protein